ncbi:MAG TPA: ABC transporter permease [Candidatus Limnocylindrales bacterium]
MELVSEVVAWFTDPANWSGTTGIPNRLFEHVMLSIAVIVVGVAVSVPLGLAIGHTRRGAFFTVSVANVGRAIPSYALLLIFFTVFGIGFATAFPALLALSIPPVLTSTYVGVTEVDPDIVEAGRGTGMTESQLLRRVELPLAMPVILAGIRTAAVQVVATATLAALVGGGGLGRFIVDGFALQQDDQLVGGAILVAVLALLTERSFTYLERAMVSPGLRRRTPEAPLTAAARSA